MATKKSRAHKRWCHLRIVLSRADIGAEWCAEVQNDGQPIPELNRRGATAGKATASAQVAALLWIARCIESGQLEPLEFSISIGVPNRTPEQSYQEAVARLGIASGWYLEPDHQQKAVQASLATTSRFLHDMGFDGWLLSPLDRLSTALEGLASGTVDPILKPGARSGKPSDPISAWTARAALAAAVEVRKLYMREPLRKAAARVVADAAKLNIRIEGAKRESLPDAKRLIQLRKDFRSSKSSAPKEGLPRHVWDTTIRRAAEAAHDLEPRRTAVLNAVYQATMLEAVQHRKQT